MPRDYQVRCRIRKQSDDLKFISHKPKLTLMKLPFPKLVSKMTLSILFLHHELVLLITGVANFKVYWAYIKIFSLISPQSNFHFSRTL